MNTASDSIAPTKAIIPQTCDHLDMFIGRIVSITDMLRAQADRRDGAIPETAFGSEPESEYYSAMDRLSRTMDRLDRIINELSSQADRNMGVA